MNKSIEFLQTVIDRPGEILGISKIESLDITVKYLMDVRDSENLPLLYRTIEELYSELSESELNTYNDKRPGPTYVALNNLLKSSRWSHLTLKKILEFYIRDFKQSAPIEGPIINCVIGIGEQSTYLASEDLPDYFEKDVAYFDRIDQIIYCLHVLNVCYAVNMNDLQIELKLFSSCAKRNLFFLINSSDQIIVRFAVFAFHWFKGGTGEIDKFPSFGKQEWELFKGILEKNIDNKTNIRAALILIKSDPLWHSKMSKDVVSDWANDIYKENITGTKGNMVALEYGDLIQQRLIESLSIDDDYLLTEVVVPYLGLTASDDLISKITTILDSPFQRKRCAAAIILSGLKAITSEQIRSIGMLTVEIFDFIVKLNSDLSYQVFGRDSTGDIAWYFILVDRDKREEFLSRQKGDNYDLGDYGKIISSGYGEVVPEDVKEVLMEKYGFDNF